MFEYDTSAIHRIDLDENEELEAVEQIGSQPGGYRYPVLLQTTNDFCTWSSAFFWELFICPVGFSPVAFNPVGFSPEELVR